MANYNNGGWYYGNKNDAWSIKLNKGASLGAPVAPKAAARNIGSSKQAEGFYQPYTFTAIEHNRQPVNATVTGVAGARMEKKADHKSLAL